MSPTLRGVRVFRPLTRSASSPIDPRRTWPFSGEFSGQKRNGDEEKRRDFLPMRLFSAFLETQMFATFLDTHLATLTVNQASRCSNCGVVRGAAPPSKAPSAAAASVSAFLARVRAIKAQTTVDHQRPATDRLSRKVHHQTITHTPMLDRGRKSLQPVACKRGHSSDVTSFQLSLFT